jgi:hypothetical protein
MVEDIREDISIKPLEGGKAKLTIFRLPSTGYTFPLSNLIVGKLADK